MENGWWVGPCRTLANRHEPGQHNCQSNALTTRKRLAGSTETHGRGLAVARKLGVGLCKITHVCRLLYSPSFLSSNDDCLFIDQVSERKAPVVLVTSSSISSCNPSYERKAAYSTARRVFFLGRRSFVELFSRALVCL